MTREDEWDIYLLGIAMGSVSRHRRTNSLFEALRQGLVPPRFIKVATEIVEGYPYPRRPSSAIPARGLPYNDPGWHDVVRAYEEDR